MMEETIRAFSQGTNSLILMIPRIWLAWKWCELRNKNHLQIWQRLALEFSRLRRGIHRPSWTITLFLRRRNNRYNVTSASLTSKPDSSQRDRTPSVNSICLLPNRHGTSHRINWFKSIRVESKKECDSLLRRGNPSPRVFSSRMKISLWIRLVQLYLYKRWRMRTIRVYLTLYQMCNFNLVTCRKLLIQM